MKINRYGTVILTLTFAFALMPLIGFAQSEASVLVPIIGDALPGDPSITPPPTPVMPSDFAELAAMQGLPVKNMGILKAYAIQQATQGGLTVYGPSIVGKSTSVESPRVSGRNAVEVLYGQDGQGGLVGQSFSFELSNLKDPVGIGVSLSDSDGYQLFSGWSQVSMVAYPDGRIWIDPNQNHLTAALNQNVAIKIPGIESARVIARNQRGEVIYQNELNAGNNHLFFPTNLVERTGEMIVTFRESDGRIQTRVFGLDGGVRPTWRASGKVSLGLEGFYDFGRNPESVRLSGVDMRSAVVHFEVDSSARVGSGLPFPTNVPAAEIGVGGKSVSGEVPIAFLLRGLNSQQIWSYHTIEAGERRFFVEGRYELIYVLDPADLEGVPIQPYGGGKGF